MAPTTKKEMILNDLKSLKFLDRDMRSIGTRKRNNLLMLNSLINGNKQIIEKKTGKIESFHISIDNEYEQVLLILKNGDVKLINIGSMILFLENELEDVK